MTYTMLAKAKTVEELQAAIDIPRDNFILAAQSCDRSLRHPANAARVEARMDHLWAQYTHAIHVYAVALVASESSRMG
jgi:hypothetical protein